MLELAAFVGNLVAAAAGRHEGMSDDVSSPRLDSDT
jgi:hypothetical protein